jgi:predicted 2-oxoglutarate/Fe(II)-dependent dioxygenase YbiX
MDLKKYIKYYDGYLTLKKISKIIRWANTQKFEAAKVLGNDTNGQVDTKIRNTKTIDFHNSDMSSLTKIHLYNLFTRLSEKVISKYSEDVGLDTEYTKIIQVSILKYDSGGFYNYHSDHHFRAPRTLSLIYILNDDYEGGNLCFKLEGSEYCIENKSNRVIIWPSNFLYPHTVKPVTKGLRYSIVSWAL